MNGACSVTEGRGAEGHEAFELRAAAVRRRYHTQLTQRGPRHVSARRLRGSFRRGRRHRTFPLDRLLQIHLLRCQRGPRGRCHPALQCAPYLPLSSSTHCRNEMCPLPSLPPPWPLPLVVPQDPQIRPIPRHSRPAHSVARFRW